MTQLINPNLTTPATQHFRQTSHVVATTIPSAPLFKDLAFPLNVYAHALLLEEGKAAYLHYGLFQHDKASLQTAQQFSTDLVISKLPPPPSNILEVGVGLGTTFSLLVERGYKVHGITPDAQQIAFIRHLFGSDIPVSCHALEDFAAPAESFDVMLFQESAQYIEPLIIFNQALNLLTLSGDLVIIDEFALQYDKEEAGGLHLLGDFVAQAKRFGFELVEHMDLSIKAAPTLDHLRQMISSHRQNLMRDLALSDTQLSQLDDSLNTYHKRYASGHYGYALLHFRKKTIPKWRLQILEKKHIGEMFNLFKKTFHHSMTAAMWQWKYESNSSRELGIWRENKLIAHYGGVSRNILLFGEPQIAVQIGDVMVDTNERGVLTRKGPFFLMAATFLERYIGYGKPYLIGFGFPNERAMKVAERYGLYAEVGRMVEFSWNTRTRIPLWKTRLQLIDYTQNHLGEIAVIECWYRMTADMKAAIIGIRDWQYLQHRYLNHPNQQYHIILVKNRFGGRARGIMVLRYDPDGCEIIDLITALREIPLMITHARRLARIHGVTRVFCRITENFANYFAMTGGTQQTVDIRIPANAWSNGPSTEELKNHWWLMSGDMDFR